MKQLGWCALMAAICTVSFCPSASSQGIPISFRPPSATQAVDGMYLVQWDDVGEQDPAVAPVSIAWYYSLRPDGSDKRRLTTLLREDFSGGYLMRWQPNGPFQLDWSVKREIGGADSFSFLRGGREAGPILLKDTLPRDVVISVRVRPTGVKNEFGISLRPQGDDRGFDLRNSGLEVSLHEQGKELQSQPLGEASFPRRWYWYEISCRNQQRAVEIRVRVYDEKRQRLLASFQPVWRRPAADTLLRAGGLALWGPADFAEVYVDPWQARWVDGRKNQLMWDTSGISDGSYYLIAETDDGRGKTRQYVSPYRVEVRHRGPGTPVPGP